MFVQCANMIRRLCLFLLLLHFNKCESSTKPSVLIVGAGAAGIAAATKLLESSFGNITILEAEDRVGGRIHTLTFEDGVVEMGAEVCDGIEDNVVYDLVKDLDILHPDVVIFGGNNKLYYSNGSTIDSSLAQDIGKAINGYVTSVCNESDGVSIGEGFQKLYKSKVLDKYAGTEVEAMAEEGSKFAETVILTMEGVPWTQPSARKHNRECRSDKFFPWKGKGFKIIFDILTKSYPDVGQKLPIDDKIHFNQKVSKINWNRNGVTAQTADCSYTADHLIFTPSLGVLQAQKETLFDPPLPRDKLNALEALGYGTMMKIFLHFPSVWWKDEDIFFFLWSREELSRHTDYIPLLRRTGNPNVLVAWIGGPTVPDLERLPEDKLLAWCNSIIKKFLGRDYHVIAADKLLRTNWSSNSNFQGTWSYEKKEHFRREVHPQEELARPLKIGDKPVVLFAGEATSSRHYGTAQGAIESGWREAERIMGLH